MGHASVRVTLDIYSHLLPDNATQGRDILDA
jgi:hypothetical protein